MVLFEVHQRFKAHFLNELRVSFNLFQNCSESFKNKEIPSEIREEKSHRVLREKLSFRSPVNTSRQIKDSDKLICGIRSKISLFRSSKSRFQNI